VTAARHARAADRRSDTLSRMTQLLFAALMLVVATPGWSQGGRPDFTGKWSLDAAKSDFGQMPPPELLVHQIEHKEPNIKITTTQKSQAGETTNTRILTTDGKPSTNKIAMMGGEQEVKSSAKWDGEKLLMTAAFDAQGTAVELNDTWTLSDEGKVLTIVRLAKTPQGDFTVKTVYNKQ
jgi:hypothetical protein